MESNVFLETVGLTKKFEETIAVNNVNLQVKLGEIRGLIGENGSGKSTVSSMICGIHPVTNGEMFINGEKYQPKNPLEARDNKISMIVQETGTLNQLPIVDNIFLGDEARFRKNGFIDRSKMIREAEKALELVDLDGLDVTKSISTLDFEERKLVEIARALYYNPTLFIVDETTTALSHEGREMIHKIIKKLKRENKAVLFISHDLPELISVCDALTILRDGEFITEFDKKDFEEDRIKQSMVGRKIEGDFYRSDYDGNFDSQVVLSVKNVSAKKLKDITLDLHKGEILGIGGLSGSGMHELGKLMYGGLKTTQGEVFVYGEEKSPFLKSSTRNKSEKNPKPIPLRTIKIAIDNKIGYVSKDRDQETLILDASVKDNLAISALDKLKKYGFILPGSERRFAEKQINELNIKCRNMNQNVRELSGGNKQKISFGKWIGNNSRILILDSPTRGVDVGVKTTMYKLLYDLKKQGYSILIISEELQELIGMSDRILMMKEGRINKEFARNKNLNESTLIDYMI
ncbi:ribose transport system ATP-binding protein [Natronobacillus azotifigens]|uniref:Sugar ABC transporter ATP-binding protein n=1 Tax=Natronobacillus azotifigens TaxID=472978 RepID=A0A9J6RA28_9BACI|nr:sugar ABC transporter ATP-binding protein [Natronobacillus azotifigens]MCZ0702504.1 sugar ABC transporter ATP-binding protein [Natronobacillus azotifigens]